MRVLAHGGHQQILGLEGNTSIEREPSIWDGILVTPSASIYVRPLSTDDEEEEEADDDGDDGDDGDEGDEGDCGDDGGDQRMEGVQTED